MKHVSHGAAATIFAAPILLLAGCDRPVPPDWARISPAEVCQPPEAGCTGEAFFLDRANIERKAGVPYVTLQVRREGKAAAPGFGIIRAEANCGAGKLEPTALKVADYDAAGQASGNRMTVITAADEAAVLAVACAGQ